MTYGVHVASEALEKDELPLNPLIWIDSGSPDHWNGFATNPCSIAESFLGK